MLLFFFAMADSIQIHFRFYYLPRSQIGELPVFSWKIQHEFAKNIIISFSFSGTPKSYEIIDIKNSHLIYIKDPQATLPYLSQIKTNSGKQGIVIKI